MDFNSKYKSSEIEGILDSVGGKQDAIADLDAIRSGAEKGATALQSIPSEYVTETELTAKGYATTSALNNKVDKVSGKQLSTQDFTTELEGKLKGIEANAQKNVQSDWNENDRASDAYVNNRTHYSYDIEQVTSFSIASKNQGDILITGLYEGVFYRIYNNAGGKNKAFHFVEGRKVVIPSNGPTIEAVCAYEDDYCMKLTTPTYGMTESFVLKEVYVEQLDDVYIPETIARKAEIATINGQSLTEGGDITIEGGGSYDDSEIRDAISQLSAITDDFNSDIANLYNVKQDTLESGTNIKTINGESILGSGDIEISGGEDIRYFTEFTVEDIIEASATNSTVMGNYSKLINAAANNNLICIPYKNTDTGFVIASYSYKDYSVDVRLEYNGNVYKLYETDNDAFITVDYPISLSGSIVELQIGHLHQIEVTDNTFYSWSVEGEFSSLTVAVFNILHKGSTIRFFSSHWTSLNGDVNPPSLKFYGPEVLWPNGVMPEIEIDTWYELSLTTSGDGLYCLAVLTPFKPVE